LTRTRAIALSVAAWGAVWAFWLAVTHGYHPTFTLAIVVTTSLVVAYASAAYVNHLVLVPRYWDTRRYATYGFALLTTMAVLTALALTIIRISYFNAVGPDADPNGTYKHFAIDFAGMAVHLALAATVVWAAKRFMPAAGNPAVPRG
jgi:uncharacterized membrane protein